MYAESQKLHLIAKLLEIDNDAILTELELVFAKTKPTQIVRKTFVEISESVSQEDAEELERIINEGCEQIN